MSQSPIDLKGCNFTLSVVHLHQEQPEAIRQALIEKIKQAPAFLSNAPVVLNVAELPVDANLTELKKIVTSTGLRVVGFSGCKEEEQINALNKAGLAILSEGKQKDIILPSATEALIIDKPVRTGQQIYARNADLIVTGNVSAGAELISDCNIHIYGTMRGRALAGASGNLHSRIFCTNLAAELVSIAGQYWLSEQIPAKYHEKSVQLSLKNNALTINYLK